MSVGLWRRRLTGRAGPERTLSVSTESSACCRRVARARAPSRGVFDRFLVFASHPPVYLGRPPPT